MTKENERTKVVKMNLQHDDRYFYSKSQRVSWLRNNNIYNVLLLHILIRFLYFSEI